MTRQALSFLEATKILRGVQSEQKEISVLASGSLTQLEIYLKAEAALRGIHLRIETLPFGLLRQHLMRRSSSSGLELLLLCPWDFLGALDWRTGGPLKGVEHSQSLAEILDVAEQIGAHSFDAIFYLPAPMLPAVRSINSLKCLELEIEMVVRDLGAEVLPREAFSLDSYLANGCPLSGQSLGETARMMATNLFDPAPETKKIIITDLDHTLWHGILGEDGLGGITADPEGCGYIHFLYQSMLKRLKDIGVLIAVVSKNDEDLVEEAFSSNKFTLGKDDFVSVHASYQPKSLQIQELAKRLNLGLEHFVFIDDNPLEIQEVGQSLPAVTCIQFPKEASGLRLLMETLHRLFPGHAITAEDAKRTDFYRQMARSVGPVLGGSHNITAFLRSLAMKMTIHDRSTGDRTRAVQLINKTNQFNINGVRRSDEEIAALLAQGARLYTAELSDVNGNHGEVLTILIDSQGVVLSYVMSCRVFQRRAEFAFLGGLTTLGHAQLEIKYTKTERNEPVRLFILELFPNANSGGYTLGTDQLSALLDVEGSFFEIVIEAKA